MKVYKLDPNAPDILTSKEYYKDLLKNHPTVKADDEVVESLVKPSINTIRASEHQFICDECKIENGVQTYACKDAVEASDGYLKRVENYRVNKNIVPNVKHCMGISDFLNIGYIIPMWVHMRAARVGDAIWVEAAGGYPMGEAHTNEQVNTEYFGIETSNKASHKFYLPYRFEAEEGKGLYLHDAFWDGTKPYRIVEGVVDTRIVSSLNVNTFWNFKDNWETFEMQVGQAFAHVMEIDIDTPSVLHQYEYDSPESKKFFKERSKSEITIWTDKYYNYKRKKYKK